MSNELLDNIIDLALKAGLGSVLTAIVFALGKPEKVRAFVVGWARLIREFARWCVYRRRGRMMYVRALGFGPYCGHCLEIGRGRQVLAPSENGNFHCAECGGECTPKGWVIDPTNY